MEAVPRYLPRLRPFAPLAARLYVAADCELCRTLRRWLAAREPVYGFRFAGEWLDIGELSQLEEADRRYRLRAGLRDGAAGASSTSKNRSST